MPLVQVRSLDLLTSSPARYHCATDAPWITPVPGIQGNSYWSYHLFVGEGVIIIIVLVTLSFSYKFCWLTWSIWWGRVHWSRWPEEVHPHTVPPYHLLLSETGSSKMGIIQRNGKQQNVNHTEKWEPAKCETFKEMGTSKMWIIQRMGTSKLWIIQRNGNHVCTTPIPDSFFSEIIKWEFQNQT